MLRFRRQDRGPGSRSYARIAFIKPPTNAGALGILVGDGRLPNPGSEKIIETYNSFPVFSTKVTLDYQLIVNSAYNRDRGPVSALGVRAPAQYQALQLLARSNTA